MQTKEYRTVDKSEWGPGPWQDEPDKMQWQDEATGLPCLIVRSAGVTGALCGYVGVAEGHPCFGKDYEAVEAEVHGGLTFADRCQPREDESHGICHAPEPGEPDHVWWLGFDCAHSGDISPAMEARYRRSAFGATLHGGGWEETYKDIAFVKSEVTNLARQLKAAA